MAAGLILTTISAARTHRANERTQQALDDVRLGSDFQHSIITAVDMQEMGEQILASLRSQFQDSDSGDAIDGALESVNPATLARTVMDGSLLAKACEAAADQFADRPAIQADIRESLAETYHNLGMYSQSEKETAACLKLRRAQLGDDHVDTIRAMSNASRALMSLRRYDDARPLAEEALRRILTKFPPHHSQVLRARSNLAQVLRETGLHEEAIAATRTLVADASLSLSPDDLTYQTYRHQLAVTLIRAQRLREGLAIEEELLEVFERRLGKDHPRTLSCWSHVAGAYGRIGRTDKAAEMSGMILELTEARFGHLDPRTLRALHNLAATLMYDGQFEAARVRLEDLTSRQQQALPSDHPELQKSLEALRNLDADSTAPARLDAKSQHD